MGDAVNTHDQLKRAGGGVAITVARGGARSDYVSGWYVYRIDADGKQIPTNPDAPWYDYGRKWFSNTGAQGSSFSERQRNALEQAKKWVAAQGWYDGEWAGNRDRCYVPKDINRRFPIRRANDIK